MVDWARVNELHDEVGAEDFDEVIELFLDEVAESMGRLSPDAAVKALEEEFHSIKGSALNLGFKTLAEACREGESAAANGQVPAQILADLPAIHANSLAAFEQGRAKLGTAA